jgi:hypothetical protein
LVAEFQSQLHLVVLAIAKEEIQHLEQADKHFIWLLMAEVQHKVMDNLVHVDQEHKILQELALVVEVKETGKTLGVAEEAAEELVEQESIQTYFSLTLEDIQDIMAEVATHQRDLQVEDQDGQTQMILEEDRLEVVEAQVFMD